MIKPLTDPKRSLTEAQNLATAAGTSDEYARFVEAVRQRYPERFRKIPPAVLERDYLRIVDHHLEHLLPRLARCVGPNTRRVLDFGCGSGGSAIALALAYPQIRCCGTDIDAQEIAVARERAKLYNVADRCEFHHVDKGQPLPFANGVFDFCQCSSVLEYAVDRATRRFCVHEMTRLVAPGGLLFFSVPNRLYPFEVHTGKWGWNYFPTWLSARIVDSSFWEVRSMASPTILALHRTPLLELVKPWSNFCLRKESA